MPKNLHNSNILCIFASEIRNNKFNNLKDRRFKNMIKSECIDRNEVIRYYHLSFNDFNDYEIPNSLIVNWQLPSFDSQNIELINEKKEYIISEYKKKYSDKEIFCEERSYGDKCKVFCIGYKVVRGFIEIARITLMDVELKLMV